MYSSKPRVRVFSLVRKMNPNQASQMPRVPKQEAGGSSSNRRYMQQQARAATAHSGAKNGNSSAKSSVTIEEVPNHAFLENLNNQSGGQKIDEEKLPVFLIKLWNMIEDPSLQSIIYWDESGGSFHINDPYTFCRNVLPHYFKHNNLNSMIRQLNMYGFRKMTPLSQGGLTRTESDQDHLEFQHPCFIQNRPELLSQIKRKSAKEKEEKQASEQTAQNLEMVMNEMRSMRDKARHMEAKMNTLTKENRDIWEQMTSMRQQHARQQQYFKKLLHFLVSVMQPGLSKRVAKRGVLEIDFGGNNGGMPGGPSAKRPRNATDDGYRGVCDLLESLQRETQEPSARRFANNVDCGPLISEVTDEFGNSPGARSSDMFSDFPGMPRYTDNSREESPHPIISQPSSSANLAAQGAQDDFKFGGYGVKEQQQEPPQPQHYMGSGALTHENVHRGSPAKRDFQGSVLNSSGIPMAYKEQPQQQQYAQKRAPYKTANRQFPQNQMQQPQYSNIADVFATGSDDMPLPPQISYQMPNQPSSSSAQPQNQLMRIEDQDTHADMCSPLALSPSFDRAISQEMQDYFTGYDNSLDNLRDLMNSSNWDAFGDHLPEDDEEDPIQNVQHQPQQPLALKNEPESAFRGFDDADGDLLDEMVDGAHQNGFDTTFPGC